LEGIQVVKFSRRLDPWKTLSRIPVFSGGPIREITRESVQLPDGRIVDDYFTARFGDYALVYAVTREGEVLVLRQYKHGVGRVCLTFPGGYVAPGEDPGLAAERELLEETGYRAGRLAHLGSFVVNANQGCNTAHLYRADGCWKECEPNAGDLEEMELHRMTPAELLTPGSLDEFGVLGYVTLLLLATRADRAATAPTPLGVL
jgi:ADP-ribose pyrophosphatase